MKKCKSCQKEIDSKAKKCPYCQTDQRSWFLRHPILTVLLILFVIGMIGAASGGKSSKNPTATQTSTGSQTEEVVPTPMRITASELADDFDSNQVAAESKWKDKLVEFSAEISNITDTGISFYKVATKEFSMAQISCRVKDKQQLLPLKNGKTVTVRGVVGTQTIGVIDIKDCEVVQ